MTTTTVAKNFVRRDGGQFERREFQIAATKEAYRILSDGLYSRKIEAVIRELSTNAVDGHIMADNNDVFEIHLPSYSEPWFTVRDYGIGMSHEDVMDLYATYFGTNKADDLDTTGYLGLGSKSPLSKVRSFSVISRFNGIERHYMVSLNEERLPEIAYLVDQDKPTTATGVEVHMAVDTSDIYEYGRRAGQVYFHFDEDKRPRIINTENYTLPEKEILIHGTGWRMYKGGGTPIAKQGNVGYPISSEQIKHIKPHHQTILSGHLEMDFPNGSVAFTPSRENLSYEKTTCEALTTRLDEVVEEVNETISKRFADCKTLWEARTLAWTMFWSSGADLRYLKKFADTGEIKWKNEKIAGQQLAFGDIDGVSGWAFTAKQVRRGWGGDHDTKVSKTERNEFTPRDNVVWCEIDLPRGSYSRCQYHVRKNNDVTIYLVQFDTPESRQAFCDKMGLAGDEFTLTSKMPKPPSVTRTTGAATRASSLVYEHTGRSGNAQLYKYWNKTEIDLDSNDGGVYVEMKHSKIVNEHGGTEHPSCISSIKSLLTSVGHPVEVIGVRLKIAKFFRKSDDWVDIFTYAKNIVNIEVVQKNLAQNVVNAEELDDLQDSTLWASIFNNYEKLNPLYTDGSFFALMCDLRHMKLSKVACPKFNEWKKLAELCGSPLVAKAERNLSNSIEKMYKDYPLMKLMVKTIGYYSEIFSSDELKVISEYIHLLEDSKFGG